MKREFFLFVLSICVMFTCADETDKGLSRTQYEEKFLQKISTRCQASDNSACVMYKLLTYMDKMLKKPSFSISKRVSLVQTSLSRNQSDVLFGKFIEARNVHADDVALTMLVADKLWTFVKSRALKWKMTDFTDVIVSAGDRGRINLGMSVDAKRALIEGRGKMKNTGPIIAAIVLKGALLGILAFKFLAILSGKALLVSKLAFLLSSLLGLKKLFHSGHNSKHVTYEVVGDHHRYDMLRPQQPQVQPQSVQPNASGWQRAFDDTLDSFIENFAAKFTN